MPVDAGGDGAQEAVLAFSRLPAAQPAIASGPKPAQPPKAPTPAERPRPEKAEEAKKPKRLFEGLRKLWARREN